jgi:hypothetical protein
MRRMRSGDAVSGLPEKIGHFIGGRHVPSVSGRTFGVANPVSNRTRFVHVALGGTHVPRFGA